MNMATLSLKASRKEQRSVNHFLWAKGLCPNTIHSEMRPVYCSKCFTRRAIHARGQESVVEAPGRCVVSMTDAAIAAVASLMRSDRRVSISVQRNLDNMLKNKRLMFDI